MKFEGVGCPLETRMIAMKLSMALGHELDEADWETRAADYDGLFSWFHDQLEKREWRLMNARLTQRGDWWQASRVVEIKPQKQHDPRHWVNMNQYDSKGRRRR